MADIDNDDAVGAFLPEQTLDENPFASRSEEASPVWVWAFDEEESGDRHPLSPREFTADNDNWLSGFLPEEAVQGQPLSSSSDDLPLQSVIDQLEPDFCVAPAALHSPKWASRLVPVGTGLVLAATLVAYAGLKIVPRSTALRWSRLALSKVEKTLQQPAVPLVDQRSAPPATPVTQAASAERTTDHQNTPSSPDGGSLAKRDGTAPQTITVTPSHPSPVRKAAVPIRVKSDATARARSLPAPSTRAAVAIKGTDAPPEPEGSSVALAGLAPTPTASLPAATAGVAPAPSLASRVPETAAGSPSVPLGAPTPAVAAATPTATAREASESAVRSALSRYVSAYRKLDVGEAKAIWPSVDSKALGRAFAGLESQAIYFRDCQVSVAVVTAKARCVGTAEFVPKIGNRTAHLESREWTFDLKKSGEQWTIAHLDVR